MIAPKAHSPAVLPASRQMGWLCFVVLFVTLLRLGYAAFFPLDLAPDESYYWDWSRQLDYGYFSKPPLIAWLMGALSLFPAFGDHVVKTAATILTGLASLLFVLWAREAFSFRIALLGFLALTLAPASTALSLFLTIDPPLLLAWSACLWLGWRRTTRHDPDASTQGIVEGLFLALFFAIGLLSKQMMVVFPLCFILFYLLSPGHRPQLRQPFRFWPFFLGLLGLLPPLIWNWRNDWITFAHTAHHFESAPQVLSSILARWGEFIGSQLGLIGPVLGILFAVAGLSFLGRMKHLSDSQRFALCFSIFPLLVILLLPLRQSLQANWALVFYPPGLFLLAVWVVDRLAQEQSGVNLRMKWFKVGLATSAVLTLLTLTLPFVLPQTQLAGSKLDPTTRLRGWSAAILAVVEQYPDFANAETVWVDGNRQWASQIAFYHPARPQVWRWPREGDISSQYDLWGRGELPSERFAYVLSAYPDLAPDLVVALEDWEELVAVSVSLGANRSRLLKLYRVNPQLHSYESD
jgi:4-amino-4-deoxy-L-arabinose transferase-like glycosyltransferase